MGKTGFNDNEIIENYVLKKRDLFKESLRLGPGPTKKARMAMREERSRNW